MGNIADSEFPSTGISDIVLVNGTTIEEYDSSFHGWFEKPTQEAYTGKNEHWPRRPQVTL